MQDPSPGDATNDRRDVLLESWALELNLIILNQGSVPTCVRPQGSSVVDLTISSYWISQQVYEWHVTADAESLSDHSYAFFSEYWSQV